MADSRLAAASEGAAQEDALLVSRLRKGEQAAYTELCDRFGPRLHRFVIARLMGDEQLAEDVTIQTLAAAARQIGRFDPRRATLSTWLHGLARREVHRELRAQRRRKSVPASVQTPLEEATAVADGRDLAADTAARVDAQRRLRAAVTALSPVEFDVLVLSAVAEFSARDIGHVVGRSERAVHSILHRARRKVRERTTHDG